MASRMERYYREAEDTKKRSQRNQNLYRNIYDQGEYSNIEAVATLDRTNEIDITKVQRMLKSRESYKRQKEYRTILNREEKEEKPTFVKEEEPEEKSYDIRDVLEKVQANKTEADAYHSLDNTNYNILKELKIKENKKKDLNSEEEQELKELINTITSTSLLNKLDNEELSLNLFSDLASSGKTEIHDKNSVSALLEEARAIEKKKQQAEHVEEIDTSFYTSSLGFNKNDFDDDELDIKPKNSTLKIKIVVGIILALISIAIIFVIFKFIK